jgi:hypothetical protein
MSKDTDRTALGEWDRDAWDRNDPHTQPSAGDADTYGEWTWDEYAQAWVRTQAEQQQRKIERTFGLRWLG